MLKSSKIIFPKVSALGCRFLTQKKIWCFVFYFLSQLATQDIAGNIVLQILTELSIL